MAAKFAKEQGHDVVLWLWREAVTLSRKGTAGYVMGVFFDATPRSSGSPRGQDSH